MNLYDINNPSIIVNYKLGLKNQIKIYLKYFRKVLEIN